MAKPKSACDLQIEGLTDLYNDTIKKAKEATDPQARKDLKDEALELTRLIRQTEEVKRRLEPKKFLGFFKR